MFASKAASNVQLPKHPGKDLKEKKLISLAKKYGSIPADKISYYPAPTAEILAKLEEQKQIDSDEETNCSDCAETQAT